MSWAIYVRYDEADMTEYVESFTDRSMAIEARDRYQTNFFEDAEEVGPVAVVLVEEP